jgi:hypothetical protein
MRSITEVLGYGLFVLSLIVIEFFLYYSKGQTIGPLIVGAVLGFIVLGIILMAIFEPIKHRNDKEA